jgi:hypothetical protein
MQDVTAIRYTIDKTHRYQAVAVTLTLTNFNTDNTITDVVTPQYATNTF